MEQAASSGEVLIGSPTFRLVRDMVDAEPVEPLTLKGKAEPMPALRIVSELAARTYTHVVVDECELDYGALLA